MLRFSVPALEKSPVTLRGELGPEFLDLEADPVFAPTGPVTYELTGKLVSGGALVTGRCAARLRAACGRCLRDFDFPLEARPELFFELAAGQEELEVADDIRAELLLELPMNPVCRPDCRGLCPNCGADLNRGDCGCAAVADRPDSPWGALDALKLE